MTTSDVIEIAKVTVSVVIKAIEQGQENDLELPNFQGKSPGIFPLSTPGLGTFGFQKGLKVLSHKVFRFIQPTRNKSSLRHCLDSP